MHDRILQGSLRITIIGLITLVTLGCFILMYQGLYFIVTGNIAGLERIAVATGLALTAALLIRHRADLIDQRQ